MVTIHIEPVTIIYGPAREHKTVAYGVFSSDEGLIDVRLDKVDAEFVAEYARSVPA